MQEFRVGANTVRAYLALPKSGRGSGIVVCHAWWGLTEFFKQICNRLADEGFVALAPDLYHGFTADSIEEAKHLRAGLARKTANQEVKAAADYLISHQAVNNPKIGAMGFSLGCSFALEISRSRQKLVKAVVIFYGTGGGNFNKTQASYLGHFAENDQWGADQKKVQKLKDRLISANRDIAFFTYAGTKHWFFEEDRLEAFNEEASHLAWNRTIDFLHENLE